MSEKAKLELDIGEVMELIDYHEKFASILAVKRVSISGPDEEVRKKLNDKYIEKHQSRARELDNILNTVWPK